MELRKNLFKTNSSCLCILLTHCLPIPKNRSDFQENSCSRFVLSMQRHAWFLLVHLLPQSAFNVTVFYIIVLFSFKKSSLSTQNVSHFVLFMLFTCSQCTVVSITFFSALYIGPLVVLVVFTHPWYTVISCAPFACFCLVPYYILLSFDFILYAHLGFVIVLVFLVPHIKLVYLAIFIFCHKIVFMI